jgi:hypothetical protein
MCVPKRLLPSTRLCEEDVLEEDEPDKVESVVDLNPAVTLPCHVFTAATAGVAEDLVYLSAEQNLALLQDL